METSEILEYVKRQFGDESAVQITDADIIRWINAAQREIVMHNEAVLQTTTTVDLVQSQQEYTLPVNLLVLRSIRVKLPEMQSYQYIESRNLQEFDKSIAGWDGTFWGDGLPHIYTIYDRTIFLFPAPNQASTDGLKILYSRKPADITDTLEDIELPEEYHNAIIKYCMSQATTLDEDYEASAIHKAEFLGDVRTLTHRMDYGARETYPTITVLPDDAW